jgi:hypothetical protein
MATTTYPKKSHTVGEQTASVSFRVPSKAGLTPPGTSGPTLSNAKNYPARGHKGPNSRHVSREQTRAPFINGSGTTSHPSYPGKTHAKFPSEGARNVIKTPTSGMPKEA